MHRTLTILIVTGLIAGCAWSPDRDNPFDPKNPETIFVQPNRAPIIDTMFIHTHCIASPEPDICTFEVFCAVTDSDNNVAPNTLKLVICEGETLGHMNYSAEQGMFEFGGRRDELPDQGVPSLQFLVIIEDDSGARAEATDRIESWPDLEYYPILSNPGTIWPPFSFVQPEVPRFSWRTVDPLLAESLSVSIAYIDIYPIWDTTGISVYDTVITVNYPFENAATNTGYYTWRLTAHDREGNTSTSLPGLFRYFWAAGQNDMSQNQLPK